MGLFYPKPYKVKRNGEWVTITPEPREYKNEPLKPIQMTNCSVFKRILINFKRKKK